MKSFIRFLLLSGLGFSACERDDLDPVIQEMESVRGYNDWYIGTYRCGLYIPENYDSHKSYPLIIYLHGYSDTTSWNLEWYKEPITSKDPCIVLTPKCPRGEVFGWGSSYDPRVSPMMEKTYDMLEMVEKAFNVDRDRYYIYGTSMGGFGTYAAIRDNPDMFAAGYVLCGNGSMDMAPLLSEIPFWIFHGSEDYIVRVQPTRDLYQAILDYGGKVIRYTEYAGVGHNVWDYTRYETTLQSWLLAQRKGARHFAPAEVKGFTAELQEDKKVNLRWEVPVEKPFPAYDNIWYCKIYRNSSVIQEVYNNQHVFIDSSVVANSTHTYQISAVNYYFMESKLTEAVSVSTTEP